MREDSIMQDGWNPETTSFLKKHFSSFNRMQAEAQAVASIPVAALFRI